MKVLTAAACLFSACLSTALHADNAKFDLVGPKVDVRVTRAGKTLPIAEVPNLQPGDKIWLKANLPQNQSNHLLLVLAFLRGTTNEPPDTWFTEIDTWEKKTVEGTTITVPNDAEQAILFVAPETGGDFKTLRSAVKGKPGLFIRADADLNQASFEQQRIERYLALMKTVPQDDQKAIQDHSAKLATTLALKPNADCFKQPVDQQVTCLTQSSAPVLLQDGHGQSIAEALSQGASSDFINAAAVTPMAGAGVYSAYVGAIVDLVKLTSLLRTAQYQYIPAISFPEGATLNLKLNTPPSFINPKTVIVIGLPAIQKAQPPPLHAHDQNQIACLLQPKMPLLLEGAPLVFSTSFAHDMVLHVNRTGAPTDIPLTPDALEGGLITGVPETRKGLEAVKLGDSTLAPKPDVKMGLSTDLTITGTVRGFWGFDSFEGPTLTLQQVDGKNWKIVGDTQMLAGKDNALTLKGDGTACVQQIALAADKDKDVPVSFKPKTADGGKVEKDTLTLTVPLTKVAPGGYSLAIQQYGDANKEKVALTAYTGAIQLDDIKIHSGDKATVLTGQGLGDVVSVQIANQAFVPAGTGNDDKTVHLEAKTGVAPEDGSDGLVKLKDGRTMTVNVSAQSPRPGLKLLSFKATPTQQEGMLAVTIQSKDDLPLNSKLTFVVQTADVFPRTQTIEIATVDGSVHTSLTLSSNTMVLQDEHTAIGTLDPLKAFGQSAFGKLQMRPVAQDGTAGDWTPLGTLVRTPQITAVHCTTADAPTCTVDGGSLFLAQSFGADKGFSKPSEVPTGFADGTFTVPTPADGMTIFFKLRDDSNAVATVTLPAAVQKAAPAPSAPAPAAAADPVAAPAPAASPAPAPKPDPAASPAPAPAPPTV